MDYESLRAIVWAALFALAIIELLLTLYMVKSIENVVYNT